MIAVEKKSLKTNKIHLTKFFSNLVVSILRYVLLTGLCFIIIYPFIIKFTSIFLSQQDIADKTVQYIARNPTLFNISAVISQTKYFKALFNTAALSLMTGILQMISCAIIGYGFSKFRFKGNSFVFGLVIFTLIIPPQTLSIPYYMVFKDFDLLGAFKLAFGHGVSMIDSVIPVIFLSITGLGFKNGLYIFMFRQFFNGVPNELSEASSVDGASVFRTFFQINFPQARSMMLTVFLFSFAWQWTDDYYSNLFFINTNLLNRVIENAGSLTINGNPLASGSQLSAVMLNTASFLVILPLMVIYLFAQKKFVQGVESSGIVG